MVIHIQIPTCTAFAVILSCARAGHLKEKKPFVQQCLTDQIAPWLVFTSIE